ncbi:aspartate aminotransferase [Psychrobacter sp. JCM 18901]|nr:aspartate aminotransferase [Psychrobacter sp. JCM 18901]
MIPLNTSKKAAIDAINDGFTKYTAVDGTPELKTAIIEKFKRDNDISYEPNEILVSVGGKQSFFNLAQAFINPGDEVIIQHHIGSAILTWLSLQKACQSSSNAQLNKISKLLLSS